MAKTEKKTRRRRRTIAGYANMVALAGAVGMWGAALLDRFPHSYDSAAAGKGKQPYTNKRVLIVLAALVYAIQSDSLKTRLWAIPLLALLNLAVQQHRATYQDIGVAEVYLPFIDVKP